jgi:hypothetical protein
MIIKKIALFSFAMLLYGGVTSEVISSPANRTDLRLFKKVELIVTDGTNTGYSKNGTPMFEGLLRGRLQSIGYTLWIRSPKWFLR